MSTVGQTSSGAGLRNAAIAAAVTFIGLWVAYLLSPAFPQSVDQVYGPFTVVMTLVVFLVVLTS